MVDLPKAQACSPCMIALGRLNQGTSYSNYGPGMAAEWAQLQILCGVSYPTAIQTIVGNRTDLPGYAPTGYPVASCLSGKTYTVVSGDNCGKIATANNVPTRTLIGTNSILPDCSTLGSKCYSSAKTEYFTNCLSKSDKFYVYPSLAQSMTFK